MTDLRGGPLPVPPGIRDRITSELYRIVEKEDVSASSRSWSIRRLAESSYVQGFQDGHRDGSQEVWGEATSDASRLRQERNDLVRQFGAVFGEEAETAWAEQDHDVTIVLTLDVHVVNYLRDLLGLDPMEKLPAPAAAGEHCG